MTKKIGAPTFAMCGIALGIVVMVIGLQRPPVPPVYSPPAQTPYVHSVAGSGIIEAGSLNVHIGSAIDGLVEEVYVQPGAMVKKGAPLFRTDSREFVALKEEAISAKTVAKAELTRLLSEPRPEEIPPVEARVKQFQARLADEYTQYTLFQNVNDKRAISINELNQRKYASQLARYELAQAKADLALLEAGAWIEDIRVASDRVEEAQSRIDVIETNLERTIVRAPFDGMVMQVNINKGDIARGSREDTLFSDALMLFGSTDPMHVRVDVDEDDAWRVYPGAPATAFVRGNSEINFPMKFVRVEPYVIPKRSLTGENLERVDTRVLQLIYEFECGNLPIYMGQLLDVFVESKPSQGL